jgi:hypothetical protein
MNKAASSYLSITCLALLLALMASSLPVPARAAAGSALADESHMAILFLAPLVDIYEGDTLTLPYMIEDLASNGGITLAPLTPGDAFASAMLGNASIAPSGLSGSLTYTAVKAGQETVNVTVTNYFGTLQASVSFEVKPKPNYDLKFFVISEDENESGGAFRAMFTGKGKFANVDDLPLQGQGTSDLWFALWVTNDVVVCRMNPSVRGSSPFTILPGPTNPIVPLIKPPGYIPGFSLDLKFESMSLNASTLTCNGLGGFTMTYPWPASQGNPDGHNLKGLSFPGEGGVVSISGNKTNGFVIVTRIE